MTNIEMLSVGMRVVDNGGNTVGRVNELKMADVGSATTVGQITAHEPGVAVFVRAPAPDPSVPHEEWELFLRLGYIKVSRTGLFTGNLLVAADEIDRVEGDVVHLSIDSHTRTT